MKYILQPIRRP